MNCPEKIEQIITEIIRTGLLEIRSAAWAGENRRCAAIADHLHTLPELLQDYSPDRLQSYWEDWRPQFCAEVDRDTSQTFQPLWDRLRSHVPQASAAAKSSR